MRDHVEYETGDMHELAIRLPANVAIWNRLRLVSDSRGLAGPLLFIIQFLFWRASLERFQPGNLDTLIILHESFRAEHHLGTRGHVTRPLHLIMPSRDYFQLRASWIHRSEKTGFCAGAGGEKVGVMTPNFLLTLLHCL